MGIEPISPAWKAGILPMYYTCIATQLTRRNTKPQPVAEQTAM